MKNISVLVGIMLTIAHFSYGQGSGTCLSFTGTERVVVPQNSSINFSQNEAFTVEAWVKLNSLSGVQYIVDKRDANTNGLFSHVLMLNGGFFKIFFAKLGTQPTVEINSTTVPVIDQWYHVAQVSDGSTVSLYVNGVLEASASITFSGSNQNTHTFLIGEKFDDKKGWDGEIDELRVWNTARTQNELRDNMSIKLQGNEAGLVAYWPMNEDGISNSCNGGEDICDQTGNGNHGTLQP